MCVCVFVFCLFVCLLDYVFHVRSLLYKPTIPLLYMVNLEVL